MSQALSTVDLTGAVAGTTATIKLPLQGLSPAFLMLYNESGCGLSYAVKPSGHTGFVPAGAWVNILLDPGDNNVDVRVLYALPNPPVSQLVPVFYGPNDVLPNLTLGNSPIGIGGTVATSSVQTLSNEGGAANVLIIDIGDAAFNQLFTLYSDGHSIHAVDQAGVKHQVIKVQTSGNPLQLGQAADTTEVLGILLVDGAETVTGNASFSSHIIMPNNVTFQFKDTSGAVLDVFYADATNALDLQTLTAGGNINFKDHTGGATFATFNNASIILTPNLTESGTLGVTGASTLSGGLTSTGGAQTITGNAAGSLHLGDSATGNILDTQTADTYLKSPGQVHMQVPGGTDIATFDGTNGIKTVVQGISLLVGSIGRVNGAPATACGSGTSISHGMGTTPRAVVATPNIAQPGSATVGVDTPGATTFTATVGAGSALSWWCFKGLG